MPGGVTEWPELLMRKERPPPVVATIYDRYSDELAKIRDDPGVWYAFVEYRTEGEARIGMRSLLQRCLGWSFAASGCVLYAKAHAGAVVRGS